MQTKHVKPGYSVRHYGRNCLEMMRINTASDIKSCIRDTTKSTTPSVLECYSRWISYLVWTHLITNRFRKRRAPGIWPSSGFIQIFDKSLNSKSPFIKNDSGFFAIPSGIQKQNRPRNQMEKICFLHRDRLSSHFGTAIGSAELLAGCRATSCVIPVFSIACRIVFRIRRIYPRCLTPNPRIRSPSCLRCRPVRTSRTYMSVGP